MEHRTELVEVIRRIRNRWRMRLAARGAVVVFVGTVLVLLLSASTLETLRFSPPAILTFRVLLVAVFAALVAYAVMPLRRQVTDTQVALYLEEHNPSLEAAILSAVEASATSDGAYSPRLVERLVEQAIEQSHAVNDGLAIDGVADEAPWRRPGGIRCRGRALHRARADVCSKRPLRAVELDTERGSGQPLQDSGSARRRQRAARRRPHGAGEARGLCVERRRADDADGPAGNSRSCRSSPAPMPTRSKA